MSVSEASHARSGYEGKRTRLLSHFFRLAPLVILVDEKLSKFDCTEFFVVVSLIL